VFNELRGLGRQGESMNDVLRRVLEALKGKLPKPSEELSLALSPFIKRIEAISDQSSKITSLESKVEELARAVNELKRLKQLEVSSRLLDAKTLGELRRLSALMGFGGDPREFLSKIVLPWYRVKILVERDTGARLSASYLLSVISKARRFDTIAKTVK
jgi:hypothetical protein